LQLFSYRKVQDINLEKLFIGNVTTISPRGIYIELLIRAKYYNFEESNVLNIKPIGMNTIYEFIFSAKIVVPYAY